MSARELRSKSRRDKVGAGHVSPITSPALTRKQKDKTLAAKQAKGKTPVTTGKVKQASTGSPKTASTGSHAKSKSKEQRVDVLAREAATVLVGLSTPPRPKGKKKRDPPLYFKSRRSVRIKTGKPQAQSNNPIVIEDTPASPKQKSPSEITVTYEKGSPKKNKWQERIDLLDEKTRLQEAENVLQDTLTRL